MLHVINRYYKVGQELKKEIAIIIQHSLRDPRLKNILTISKVRLSRDLSNAQVFVSFLNEQEEFFSKNSINILNHASGFIRITLKKKMNLRIVPQLIFIYDNSFVEGSRISLLIKNAVK